MKCSKGHYASTRTASSCTSFTLNAQTCANKINKNLEVCKTIKLIFSDELGSRLDKEMGQFPFVKIIRNTKR